MNTGTAVAAVLALAVTAYACTGLADFGAGFWDLTAGGRAKGRRPRALVDAAISPVWESNHVWLIFLLIFTWTAFGSAFASIMTTLFIPLALAAVGIVLRAASFAMRKDAARAGARHLTGWLFGIGSVLTPFCFGAVLGAIITGRVPAGSAAGDPWSSWLNPTSVAIGLLALAMSAFLAAVYLVAVADRHGAPDLKEYFRVRGRAALGAALALGVASLVALFFDERQMFDRLVSRGAIPLVLGTLALAAAFLMLTRATVRWLRPVAVAGVVALVCAWAVAQYPYLLPFGLTISDGAAAAVTLRWVLVWFVVAVLLVGPALVLLYALDQRDDLSEETTTATTSTTTSPPSGEPVGDVVPHA